MPFTGHTSKMHPSKRCVFCEHANHDSKNSLKGIENHLMLMQVSEV